MKKIICLLAIVALSAPMFAAEITITAEAAGGNLIIGYTSDMADGDPCLPVGIALKVTGNGGAMITGVVDWDKVEYPVYLDYAYTEETEGDGYTNDPEWEGHPFAAAEDAPGALDPATLPASEVIICMGRLTDPPSAGPAEATLVTIAVDCGDGTFDVTEEAMYRGGIVSALVGTDLTVVPAEGVTCGGTGGPACWECPSQLVGDTNNDGAVNFIDLNDLKAAIFTSDGDAAYNACADFNRDGSVNFIDLNTLKQNIFTSGHETCD